MELEYLYDPGSSDDVDSSPVLGKIGVRCAVYHGSSKGIHSEGGLLTFLMATDANIDLSQA